MARSPSVDEGEDRRSVSASEHTHDDHSDSGHDNTSNDDTSGASDGPSPDASDSKKPKRTRTGCITCR
jgi:hypothetical protein